MHFEKLKVISCLVKDKRRMGYIQDGEIGRVKDLYIYIYIEGDVKRDLYNHPGDETLFS